MNIPVTIFKNNDGTFTVIGVGLNFTTEGDSLDEAMANAHEAAECHLEGIKKSNNVDEMQGLEHSFNTYLTV